MCFVAPADFDVCLLRFRDADFCFDDFDLCFHLAALSRIQPSFENPTDTFRVNWIESDDTTIRHFNYNGSNKFYATVYEPGNNDLVEKNALVDYSEISILNF